MANETKWTPGPWTRQAGGPWLKGGDGEEVVSTSGARRSNVNLICAAPDLYAALHALVSIHRPDYHAFPKCEHGCVCIYGAARDALARARGETP